MTFSYRTVIAGRHTVKIAYDEDGVVAAEKWLNKKFEPHRGGGLPAIVYSSGTEEYFLGGVYQRTKVDHS